MHLLNSVLRTKVSSKLQIFQTFQRLKNGQTPLPCCVELLSILITPVHHFLIF